MARSSRPRLNVGKAVPTSSTETASRYNSCHTTEWIGTKMINAAAAPSVADMYFAVLPGRTPNIRPHSSKMRSVTVKFTAASTSPYIFIGIRRPFPSSHSL